MKARLWGRAGANGVAKVTLIISHLCLSPGATVWGDGTNWSRGEYDWGGRGCMRLEGSGIRRD